MKCVVIILLSLMITSCKGKIYTEIPEYININVMNNISVHKEIYLHDLIDIEAGQILTDDYQINTYNIGNQKIEIIFKHNKRKYSYELSINIEDTTKPEIFASSNRTVQRGYEGELCNLIMYGDNYDKSPSCDIDGIYDISETGTYDLTYIITDSSNNSTSHNLTLHVIKPSNNQNTSPTTYLPFSEVMDRYKNDRTEIGIDVSSWQGDVDYNKIREAGATFVIIRIGFQRTANGELNLDSYYRQNIENAKKAGLKVGVYLYTIATTEEESVEHAKWVLKELDGIELDMPIVFDWESWSWWNDLNLSFYDINCIAEVFIETINSSGYKGMLYSSKYYLENIWENKYNHPVWLAHYTSETNYNGEYVMWQLTERGKIDGINGNVDINVLYK